MIIRIVIRTSDHSKNCNRSIALRTKLNTTELLCEINAITYPYRIGNENCPTKNMDHYEALNTSLIEFNSNILTICCLCNTYSEHKYFRTRFIHTLIS